MKSVTLQDVGDQRIDVGLDDQHSKLLDAGNLEHQNGWLVLEMISQEQANIPVPSVGQHITFTGTLVYDTENQWNAICPIWSIRAD